MQPLFHVSDDSPLTRLVPRPAPPGTPDEGRVWVWAVDDAHLPNYLLPRNCPRVCWRAVTGHPVLGSPSARVVAIEYTWVAALAKAGLTVHTLDPTGFTLVDPSAGYWVCEHEVRVETIRRVDDCFAALAEREVELRVVRNLWPYVDAVTAGTDEFSAIRMRNATGRA